MARNGVGEKHTGPDPANDYTDEQPRYLGPDTWLSSASLMRHAVRYAGIVTGTAVLMWLVVGLAGGNVYDRRLPVVAFPLTGFVIWIALVTYRRRLDTEMGFLRGLKLGTLMAISSSVILSLLIGLLVVVGGDRLKERHIKSSRQLLIADRQNMEKLKNGKAEYVIQHKLLDKITTRDIVVDVMTKEVLYRLVPALLVALLGAILFRKANPEGLEPEKAPRPPKQPTR